MSSIKYIVLGGSYVHFGNQKPTQQRSNKLLSYPLLSGLLKEIRKCKGETCRW